MAGGGATSALRAVALDAVAALALSPAGRARLRVHEEGLLSLAMSDRAAAEAPVMLALKRMYRHNFGTTRAGKAS